MRNDENSAISADIEYLEKAFKKFTPQIITSPYIPTPSVLVKGPQISSQTTPKSNKTVKAEIKPTPITKPRKSYSKKRYEYIIDCLHKGAQAYSVGDYGTAINHFTRLLDNDWLKHATYFYLVKTIIKLDIEKEILSLRNRISTTNIKMTKST